MPKRIQTHRIDTKAVRNIFTHLHEDWLVRSLEERDYGIDLQLERFNGNDATGDFIFSQVKGTDDAFGDEVKLSGFPVDTINYALMFNVPFFVFHTSNASKATKFVWLQKYAETKLEKTTPRWKDQDSVTIYFPEENDLESNDRKIIEIIHKDKLTKVGVKFLASYESLSLHSHSVTSSMGEVGVANYCAMEVENIIKMFPFIREYGAVLDGSEYSDLLYLPSVYKDIAQKAQVAQDDRKYISRCLNWLLEIKVNFLHSDEKDDFAVAMGGYSPY
ncbi:DUF4365 domain-containing protein [Burkholderia multivorans]|nr:DUF4365 domain-containing protein [Burkholderia multivorans]